MTFRKSRRVKNDELTQKYNVYAFQLCLLNMCMFLNEYRSLLQIFCGLNFVRVFKFVFTCQPLC